MSKTAFQPQDHVLAVGLMSGTSADGIDAAAVELWTEDSRPRATLRAFRSLPYPADVRERVFRCFRDQATVREVCRLNALLGDLFAAAAEAVLAGLPPGGPSLAFIASHGQTVWHEPWAALPSTLQLAEAARIAERLHVPVVSDFRQQDIALGGQGAPLVPYVDYLLFGGAQESRAVQNIGGIGNVTYIPAGAGSDQTLAFDTGPGNALIDAAAVLATEGTQACDLDGRLAASAPPDAAVLAGLLSEPYFSQPPPKSTGRELFTEARVRALWERGCRGAVLVSTLTQLTVDSIAEAYRRWLGPVERVIVGGGGTRNPELLRRLASVLSPARVGSHEEFGLNSDAKEALAFAVLGYETLLSRPSNLPSATGAARPAVQGKITLP